LTIEGGMQQTILAAVLGSVLVISVIGVAFFVRRSQAAWDSTMKFFVIFLKAEGLLILEISLELWDIIGMFLCARARASVCVRRARTRACSYSCADFQR
jgi:hypothetical protein